MGDTRDQAGLKRKELADAAIVRHLAEFLYHPRSSKHGDALCEFLLRDLLEECPAFRSAAERAETVYRLNYTLDPAALDRWNTDLVVGPPAGPIANGAKRCGPIAEGDPKEVWVGIDAKTIMTEHGKARRNRQRDLNSFHDILHRKNHRSIVGGLVVVNVAPRFRSPLRSKTEPPTEHRNIERLVDEIVSMMNGLPRCPSTPGTPGLEALGVIVVSHTNIQGDETRLVTGPPAPARGHPLAYTAFLRDLCRAFGERFGK